MNVIQIALRLYIYQYIYIYNKKLIPLDCINVAANYNFSSSPNFFFLVSLIN